MVRKKTGKPFKVDTRPSKAVVVDSLTRDTSVDACIFDLIDNSIDAARDMDHEVKGQIKIRITVHWRPACVPEEDRDQICKKIGGVFEAAANTTNRKNGLRLMIENVSSIDVAETMVKAVFQRINGAFAK